MHHNHCKYCGKETFGAICRDCLEEGNEILRTNELCEKLNSTYGAFGFIKTVAIITFLITFVMVLCLTDQNLQMAATKVVVSIISFIVVLSASGLRDLYHKKIDDTIDAELTKRHKK
jgi:uncharacterized membrane protein